MTDEQWALEPHRVYFLEWKDTEQTRVLVRLGIRPWHGHQPGLWVSDRVTQEQK